MAFDLQLEFPELNVAGFYLQSYLIGLNVVFSYSCKYLMWFYFSSGFLYAMVFILFNYNAYIWHVGNGHTSQTAPHPVRSVKLSWLRRG